METQLTEEEGKEIIEKAIKKYEYEISILECCILTLKSSNFLEQMRKNK